MLGYVEIDLKYKKKIVFSFKAKTKLMPSKLRAVLATFGFSENFIR